MPVRKRSRLPTFDYRTPGAYCVTICAYRRKAIFGCCVDDELRPTAAALAVERCWAEIPVHFGTVDIDVFVVMPNHVHGILLFEDGAPTLPTVIGSFKSAASRDIRMLSSLTSVPVWQRGYYERVVRTEEELEAIRRYVLENPSAWTADPENPARSGILGSAPWT